jgi:hypothetical protein
MRSNKKYFSVTNPYLIHILVFLTDQTQESDLNQEVFQRLENTYPKLIREDLNSIKIPFSNCECSIKLTRKGRLLCLYSNYRLTE